MSARLVGLVVEVNIYSTQRERDEDDSGGEDSQFAPWGSSSSHELLGARLAGPDDSVDVIMELAAGESLAPGQSAHVLWCAYGTGDSFGSSTGNFQALAAFGSARAAARALAFLESEMALMAKEGGGGGYYASALPLDHGGYARIDCPWEGYFNSLETLDVSEVPILASPPEKAGRRR